MTSPYAPAAENPERHEQAPISRARGAAAISARAVSRRFGRTVALDDVALQVEHGEIHALLGPNGAGKTTLLRILAGLLVPTSGSVRVGGLDTCANTRALRSLIGLVPSGDRSFYLRISGRENLAFFARLHGMSKRAAFARANEVLAAVGLSAAAKERVGVYSHGMQKRLSVARALLTSPLVLLVDEATHDLDPDGARRIRALVSELAGGTTAVVWATQRLDEIRGFADRATLLGNGRIRFSGSVPELMEHSLPRRFLVRLRNGTSSASLLADSGRLALGRLGTIDGTGDPASEHFLLSLSDGTVLGDALAALSGARIQVLACRQERSEVEDAFLALTAERES